MKIGIARGLWVFGFAQWLLIFGFAWLAYHGRSDLGLAGVIALEAFAAGLGTAAFTAYIASATDPRYPATQFALGIETHPFVPVEHFSVPWDTPAKGPGVTLRV